MNIKKGDTVEVITGKYREKRGTVKTVMLEDNRVIVEGVNIVKKHLKAQSQVRQAGIIEKEAPIHVSNVMIICPSCNEPNRVGHRFENGEKVRFCKSCDGTIPDNTGWRSRRDVRES